MKTVPVTNHGNTNLHIGGKVIVPGDTLHIDERIVPPDLMPETPAEEQPEKSADEIAAAAQFALVEAIASGNVQSVVAELPALSDEDLTALEAYENANSARKGVLEAIAADRLRRAQPPTE